MGRWTAFCLCWPKRACATHQRFFSNSWSTSQSTNILVSLSRPIRWKFPSSSTLAESKSLWSCIEKIWASFSILRCCWDLMKISEQNGAFIFPDIWCCQHPNLYRLSPVGRPRRWHPSSLEVNGKAIMDFNRAIISAPNTIKQPLVQLISWIAFAEYMVYSMVSQYFLFREYPQCLLASFFFPL